MRAYIAIAKKSAANQMAFRADFWLGLLNTMIQIFVGASIWKALYGGQEIINGIPFNMVITNIVLGLSVSNAQSVDDFALAGRVHSGGIAMNLLKPLSVNGELLAHAVGANLFRLLTRLIPSIGVSLLFFNVLPPVSATALLLCVLACFMGFFVLYNLGYIISALSFWFVNIWSFSTFKNVFVTVLSGTMLPLWFMPGWMDGIIRFTPFDVLYFAPVQIYLGQLIGNDILAVFIKQGVWIAIFYAIGRVLWTNGIKKLVVAGG